MLTCIPKIPNLRQVEEVEEGQERRGGGRKIVAGSQSVTCSVTNKGSLNRHWEKVEKKRENIWEM